MTHTHIYAGSPIDRVSHLRADDAWVAARLADAGSRFVPVWRGRALLAAGDAPQAVWLNAAQAQPWQANDWALLGLRDGQAVFALDLGAAEEAPAMAAGAFEELRSFGGQLPAGDAAVLAHARGLLHWRARHRFCGVCGGACAPRDAGNTMQCTQCETRHFPRTDPAVIMLVTQGDRALLANGKRMANTGMYSTLAGFVEPGESLEEAVAREVFEEVGVRVTGAVYQSSQPWPFPASIMLGFRADAQTTAITLDPDEINDARWFTRDDLRNPQGFRLPNPDSIARRLINDWIAA